MERYRRDADWHLINVRDAIANACRDLDGGSGAAVSDISKKVVKFLDTVLDDAEELGLGAEGALGALVGALGIAADRYSKKREKIVAALGEIAKEERRGEENEKEEKPPKPGYEDGKLICTCGGRLHYEGYYAPPDLPGVVAYICTKCGMEWHDIEGQGWENDEEDR